MKTLFMAVAIVACGFGLRISQDASVGESRSVWDGVFTEDQASRGGALYKKYCASCHGVTLNGGESAPPLAGGAFLSNWNGLTLGDLFDRIRKTMPQSSPGKITRQETSDILAHMLSVNKFPSGKTELYRQTEMLKGIRFETSKAESQK